MPRTAKGLQYNRYPKTREDVPAYQAKRRALDKIGARAGLCDFPGIVDFVVNRVLVGVEQGMDELDAIQAPTREVIKRALAGMERKR